MREKSVNIETKAKRNNRFMARERALKTYVYDATAGACK